ncbi:hypothetical protein [Bacillus phage vB_BceM_Bc431v3]|uniref:AP2/ERF domain-containing protein n=1 Tax=Bacillus phage vB_BceM_Bc431v3 TaxID=1195072 RepID=M4HNJ1_9CAUD|nr:HNH endonuclease [Bacillus phage vB_BceM_Bc431v3]AFQ96434.1 hypothetical protein [Bacillus phage vB_BceM_Bc431v3]
MALHTNLYSSRLGAESINNEGHRMKCVEYRSSKDITVEFDNGCRVVTRWRYFVEGAVRNLTHPVVYGVGFVGIGTYKTQENGTDSKPYVIWHGMLRRCYEEVPTKRNSAYQGCTVDKEWHNFQNFAKWYEENFYQVGDEVMHLDKDILVKGNRVYSPDTCIFVPYQINMLFTNRRKDKGAYPTGVTKRTNGKYAARLNKKHTRCSLGSFNTPEEASLAYRAAKEEYIKEVAMQYKPFIPNNLYVALLNYKEESDD